VHILTVKHPNQTNHNGGQLMFGRYGYLYITTGDGGGAGDPYRNAENMRSALAKLLRIDIDHHCGSYNYCNPPTNPWAKSTTVLRDIFDFGLRNPWRASIDRADGSIWIGDVGQDRYEEIDHVSASGGKDFGWSCREANATYNSDACTIGGKARSMTRPVTYYGHGTNDSNGCAVIGGYAYHGPNYPFAAGLYVYADWCSGHIWALGRTSTGGYSVARVGQTSVHITGFGEGDKGEIWAVDDAGELFHVAFAKR
jgi:glucose/arabinose dehydrogenase